MELTKNTITIGADPELFLHDGTNFIPSEKFIKGTKKKPFEFEPGFAVLNDNVMCEYNIPPATTAEEFLKYNLKVHAYLREKTKCNLVFIPTAWFDEEILFKSKGYREFGCEPDRCIYENEQESINIFNQPYRFAGGHVHVGYPNKIFPAIESRVVAMMDVLLGIPFTVIDKDNMRRRAYGKAGRFRVKEFGIEYRSLSNHWLTNPELIRYVFNQAVLAVNTVMHNVDRVYSEIDVEEIINNGMSDKALEICQQYNIKLPTIKELEYAR